MKSKFLSWGGMLFALCAMLVVQSCNKDEGNGYVAPGPVQPDANGMTAAVFSGFVQPEGWGVLPGATVTSGDQTAQTGYNGYYKLDKVKVVNGRAIVKFQKPGYMSVVRSVPFNGATRLDVSLKPLNTSTFPADMQKEISLWAGGDITARYMKVLLPANGLVTEDGTAYTGQVTATSVYLDPDDSEFPNEMPGDLTAVRADNSEAQLVSYGMVAVELTDGAGKKLNLAPGQKATLTFPVTDKFQGQTLPASIPLWSFDDATGLWVEEGTATLNSDGDAYVGEVSHFSWHNLDQPELRATLKVKLVDNLGNVIPNVSVDIDGQRTATTASDGIASCVVPSNTPMVIRVASEAYGNYADVTNEYGYSSVDETKIVKMENVTLAPQETKTITLTMPVKVPVIKGKVTNIGSGSQVCVVWVAYGTSETPHVFTDLYGNYSLLAPAIYRGPATIVAQYGDGYKVQQAITITDADQVINLTANTSSVGGIGLLQVIGTGLNLRYDLPEASDPFWNAVTINPGKGLSVNAYTQSHDKLGVWGNLNLEIPDYVEGTTTYTSEQNSFGYMMEGMGGWTQVNSEGAFTVNVTKNGDVYTFKIANATGKLIDRSMGMDWDTAATVKFYVEFSARPAEDIPAIR